MEILSMNVVVSAIVDPWVTTLSFVVALAMRIQGLINVQISVFASGRKRFAPAHRSHAPAAALQPVRRAAVLLDAGFLLGALDSSHLLLGKPNGTVIFSVVRSSAAVIAQVGASCFQRRHVV